MGATSIFLKNRFQYETEIFLGEQARIVFYALWIESVFHDTLHVLLLLLFPIIAIWEMELDQVPAGAPGSADRPARRRR